MNSRVPRRTPPETAPGGPSIDPGDTPGQIRGPDAPAAAPSAAGASIAERSYSRDDRRKIETLLSRAAHLQERSIGRPDLRYDLAELAAIGWALRVIIASCGPLPEELEALRASIWPVK